jgi:hypothetical protein
MGDSTNIIGNVKLEIVNLKLANAYLDIEVGLTLGFGYLDLLWIWKLGFTL